MISQQVKDAIIGSFMIAKNLGDNLNDPGKVAKIAELRRFFHALESIPNGEVENFNKFFDKAEELGMNDAEMMSAYLITIR